MPSPTTRAVKKRKSDAATPSAKPSAGDKNANSSNSDSKAGGGVALPEKELAKSKTKKTKKTAATDGNSDGDEDDKYASAESSSEDELLDDEFDIESGSDTSGGNSDINDILAAQHTPTGTKRKRHDATIFATSMSKILSSHLTSKSRTDPVLVRAKQQSSVPDAAKASAKARRVARDEKRKEKEKGRMRDLVPVDDDEAAKESLEREKRLKGIARSGVARLYNAIRAAQVKGEEAQRGVRKEGVVGMANREEKITEMSKQGFLELIQASGMK